MTDQLKRGDWRQHAYMQTVELPRFGVAGRWDRFVARVMRRPQRMSGHEIEVTLWISSDTDNVRLANVQMEFR